MGLIVVVVVAAAGVVIVICCVSMCMIFNTGAKTGMMIWLSTHTAIKILSI